MAEFPIVTDPRLPKDAWYVVDPDAFIEAVVFDPERLRARLWYSSLEAKEELEELLGRIVFRVEVE